MPIQSPASALLVTDQALSPLTVIDASSRTRVAYSPFGYRTARDHAALTGFNGQVCEKDIQAYLLGNGYRAFNPLIRRFYSPDSYSPFGAGGYNAYCYAAGDPINHVDPSGHVLEFLGKAWRQLQSGTPWRRPARRASSLTSVNSAGLAEQIGQRSSMSNARRPSSSAESALSSSSSDHLPWEFSTEPRDHTSRRMRSDAHRFQLEETIRHGEYQGLDMRATVKTLNKRFPGAYEQLPPPAPREWNTGNHVSRPLPPDYSPAPPPYLTRGGEFNRNGRAGQTNLAPPRYPYPDYARIETTTTHAEINEVVRR